MVSYRLVAMALIGTLLQVSLEGTRARQLTNQQSFSVMVQTILKFQIERQVTMDNATVLAFEQGTRSFFESNLLYFQINATEVQSQLTQCNTIASTQQSTCFLNVYLLIIAAASTPLRANADAVFGKLLLEIITLNSQGLITSLSQRSTSIGSISTVVIFSNASLSPTPSPSSTPTISLTSKTLHSHSPSSTTSNIPSDSPSLRPSPKQSDPPSAVPSQFPSQSPSLRPSTAPSLSPSLSPSQAPSLAPSMNPSTSRSPIPSQSPSSQYDSFHTADITVQLQGMAQSIPDYDVHGFEMTTLNFITQFFPNIQGIVVEILSVAITSQALSNRRLDVVRANKVTSNLLIGMNVTASVTASSGSLAISDAVFQNLVAQIFQSHFDVYVARLSASSSVFDNLTYTPPSSAKGTSTFVIALAVCLGALGALAFAAIGYWWNARRMKSRTASSSIDGDDSVPKEVNAIHTSSTKELEFEMESRSSIPKFLNDVPSLGRSSTRHRADISVISDNFDMSVVSENFVSHWSCVVSSDCEKSDGSGHDADSDEYGDEETDVGGSKLTREADDLETTVQS